MAVLLGETSKPETPILYVPEGTVANEGEPVLLGKGSKTLEGSYVSTRTWRFTNKSNGRTQICCVVDDEMSDDAIEQAKGEARDHFLRDTEGLPRLVSPSAEKRREVGAAIKEIRSYRFKRNESSAGRIYF